MATKEEMLVSMFQEIVFIRSSFNLAKIGLAMSDDDLINFWEQTISKWPFSGHFVFELFCDIYVTKKKKENSWTMNIKQNVMSHTRISPFSSIRSTILVVLIDCTVECVLLEIFISLTQFCKQDINNTSARHKAVKILLHECHNRRIDDDRAS